MADIENIKRKLKIMNVDYDLLKPNQQQFIIRIEEYIADKIQKKNAAVRDIVNSRFNTSAVAEGIGCSRTTLYSNGQLLKKYIELSAKEFSENDILKDIDELKEHIRFLQNKIALMEERDCTMLFLKSENEGLTEKLKESRAETKRLRASLEKMSIQLTKYKKGQPHM